MYGLGILGKIGILALVEEKDIALSITYLEIYTLKTWDITDRRMLDQIVKLIAGTKLKISPINSIPILIVVLECLKSRHIMEGNNLSQIETTILI